jgi:hypothetical protein
MYFVVKIIARTRTRDTAEAMMITEALTVSLARARDATELNRTR